MALEEKYVSVGEASTDLDELYLIYLELRNDVIFTQKFLGI